jgi:hypothetical protein
MTTVSTPTAIDRPRLLSVLWIFLVLNFIYCDVLALHDGAVLSDLLGGTVGALEITPGFLLAASVLMEVPMSMVLVSRLARRTASRIANIAAGSFMIVVQTASFFTGTAVSPSYAFFSAIEIGTLAAIVLLAIRWTKAPALAP